MALLGALMYSRLMARFESLTPNLSERSNDISLYRATGESILRGEIPYRDFFIEYPPGAVPSFVPPALFSAEQARYTGLFATEMALVLVVALVVTALTAHRLGGLRAWPLSAATFAAGAVVLYPVAVTRYDPIVALALAVGALCAALGGRYLLFGYASLGLGTAAKLVPALAVLPFAMAGRLRDAGRGLAIFSGVLVLFFLPAYLLGGGNFLRSFAYHADRGVQLESVAASVLMQLGWIEEVTFDYGSFQVDGRGVEIAGSLSILISGALLLLTAFLVYREHRAGRLGAAQFPRYAAALILAFMLGSKVLSPQYLLWLLPLVPLAARRWWGAGVSVIFLMTCWATTQVFPVNYDRLIELDPGAINLLFARNLLLAILWGLMLLLPAQRPPEKRYP